MTTATTPTRSNAPDYDEIVRVVHLYSDAFGLLERQLWPAVRVPQHEPVTTPRVRLVGSRRLIAGAVLQPEQLPVELG